MSKADPVRLGRDGETYEVSVAAISGTDGTTTGHEWRITTQDHRNAAVLSAIDAGQLRAEVSQSGEITAANDRFAQLLSLSATSIMGRDCRSEDPDLVVRPSR
jgi:methyl-accepting chemotaxis protein